MLSAYLPPASSPTSIKQNPPQQLITFFGSLHLLVIITKTDRALTWPTEELFSALFLFRLFIAVPLVSHEYLARPGSSIYVQFLIHGGDFLKGVLQRTLTNEDRRIKLIAIAVATNVFASPESGKWHTINSSDAQRITCYVKIYLI